MTTKQLIQIAQAAFPDGVKQFIDFDNLDSTRNGNVWRLFDKHTEFIGSIPKTFILAVFKEGNFVQFSVENHKAINHLAAIRKMEEMKLIKT